MVDFWAGIGRIARGSVALGLLFASTGWLCALAVGCSSDPAALSPGPVLTIGTRGENLASSEWPADPLVATNSVQLDQRGRFDGSIAVTKASGAVLAHAAELTLEINSVVTGSVRTDTLFVDAGSSIGGSAAYNAKAGTGVIVGAKTTPLALPLALTLPVLPTITAGTQVVNLASNEVRALAAGAFGAVTLAPGNGTGTTKLTLGGGVYSFTGITLGTNARLECAAECEVRVTGRVQVGARSYFGPAAIPGVGPGNVRLLVKASNATPGATPAACNFDNDSSLLAWALVPNGTLRLGQRVAVRGKIVAKDVAIGTDSVGKGLELPAITAGPQSLSVWEHQPATFTVTATGPAVTYQWQKNGVNIAGANSASLTIPSAQVVDDGAQFRVVLTNEAGSVSSAPAILTVIPCQAADTVCDGVDEDCDGAVDDNFTPYCAGNTRKTCFAGHEVGVSCDNGVVCDGAEVCGAGQCGPGSIAGLDDQDPCTADSCNTALDQVEHATLPPGSSCPMFQGEAGVCDSLGLCVEGPQPFVSCVDNVGGGQLSARFGYANLESTPLQIPLGSSNQLSELWGPAAHLPTTFEPGTFDGAFRAFMPAAGTLTWTLAGKSATADGSYPACPPVSGGSPSVHPGGEVALGFNSTVGPMLSYRVPPDQGFVGPGFSDLSGAISDPQFVPSSVPPAPFHIQVNVIDAVEKPGLCQNVDAFANIAGLGEGRRRVLECDFGAPHCLFHGDPGSTVIGITSADLDGTLTQVDIHFRGEYNNRFLCLGDMNWAFDEVHTIDLTQPRTVLPIEGPGDPDGAKVTYEVLVTRLPVPVATTDTQLCATWNAEFVDEPDPTVHPTYPAAFAEFRLRTQGPLGSINLGLDYDANGVPTGSGTPGVPGCDATGRCFLDAAGCVTAGAFDANLLIHHPATASSGLQFDFRMRTDFAKLNGPAVSVRQGDPSFNWETETHAHALTYPRLVEVASPTNGVLSFANWPVVDGFLLPPARIDLNNQSSAPAVQVAAMVGQFLAHADLGITRRDYLLLAGQPCSISEIVPKTTPQTCTQDTDCGTGVDSVCVVPTNAATGFCGCQTSVDCKSPDVDRLPNFQACTNASRCGAQVGDSCFMPGTAVLFIGNVNLGLDTTRCTAPGEGQCPLLGQECLTETGEECTGSTCLCRWYDQARWKFIIGHEFGHNVHDFEAGVTGTSNYSFVCDTLMPCPGVASGTQVYDPPSVDRSCACDHVTLANQQHCLQSLERMAEAEGEGFGHFFAASAFNQTAGNCTFMYYKDVLLDACPLTSAPADCEELGPNLFRVRPPVAVPCDQAEKWRNSRCSTYNGAAEEALPEMGVERDWLQFLRAWNQGGASSAENASLTEILAAYRHTCDPCLNKATGLPDDNCTPAGCAGQRFTWAPQPMPPSVDDPTTPDVRENARYQRWLNERSYRDGVSNYYTGLVTSGDPTAAGRRLHFLNRALDRGVDENTGP